MERLPLSYTALGAALLLPLLALTISPAIPQLLSHSTPQPITPQPLTATTLGNYDSSDTRRFASEGLLESSESAPQLLRHSAPQQLNFSNSQHLSVDCDFGDDHQGEGTVQKPWKTIHKARDAIREMKPLKRPMRVSVKGDCYPRNPRTGTVDFSFPVLSLDAALDSGSHSSPIKYEALPAERRARLRGGIVIPTDKWRPHAFWKKVRVLNLKSLKPMGYDKKFLGSVSDLLTPDGRSLGQCQPHRMELFFNEQPMTLARYPNVREDGSNAFLRIDKVLDGQRSFRMDGTRLLKWKSEKDPYLHGYWKFDWADSYLKVLSVEKVRNVTQKRDFTDISVEGHVLYGLVQRARFIGVNLLSELDSPGEYYIDADDEVLYFWPPEGLERSEAVLSLADAAITGSGVGLENPLAHGRKSAPLLNPQDPGPRLDRTHSQGAAFAQFMDRVETEKTVNVKGAARLSHLEISGFKIEYFRSVGVALHNSKRLAIQGLEIQNIGQRV